MHDTPPPPEEYWCTSAMMCPICLQGVGPWLHPRWFPQWAMQQLYQRPAAQHHLNVHQCKTQWFRRHRAFRQGSCHARPANRTVCSRTWRPRWAHVCLDNLLFSFSVFLLVYTDEWGTSHHLVGQSCTWGSEGKQCVQEAANWPFGKGMQKLSCDCASPVNILLLCCVPIQMVGASTDELDAMGKGDWHGDHSLPCTVHTKFCFVYLWACLNIDSLPAFQLLSMPDDVLVEIARHLDPRSPLHFSEAHPRFQSLIHDSIIWDQVALCEDWVFHNEMFLFMRQFCDKIKRVVYRHRHMSTPCLVTFPECLLQHMRNLVSLNVSSPSFCHPYFLRYTPLIEVMHFTNCPLLDMDIFVQHVSHVKPKRLRILDLTGVPTVTSLNLWSITYVCEHLIELYAANRMSSFFGEQIFLNCQKLAILDYLPLLGREQEWRDLQVQMKVKFGPLMITSL